MSEVVRNHIIIRNHFDQIVDSLEFIGVLHGYEGTWSRAEVDRVFTLPLDWILEREPDIYQVRLTRHFPEDFPFQSVPGGEHYHWREQKYPVPFYAGTDPMLWGVTARVTHSLAKFLRLSQETTESRCR